MRAEQWMMVGVGAIGAYAAYRLLTNRPDSSTPAPVFQRPPNTTDPADARYDATLPTTAGTPDPAPSTVQTLDGSPVGFRGGAYYKGRMEVDPTLSNAALQLLLERTFVVPASAVEIFRSPSEAASETAIGQPFALARPGQGTRWFRLRVPATDGGLRARPNWITALWLAAPPGLVLPR